MTTTTTFGSLEERYSPDLNHLGSDTPEGTSATVTRSGVMVKLSAAVGVAVGVAALSWQFFNIWVYLAAVFGGLGLAIVCSRDQAKANTLLYPYAALEGYILAGFTQLVQERYESGYGIVLASVLVVSALFAGCYIAYVTGLLQYSSKFVAATGALVIAAGVFYLLAIVTNLFGQDSLSDFYSGSSVWSIGISAVMVVVAAMSLVTDFMFLRQTEGKAPKEHEAFLAMGILISVVWTYMEVLRMLGKLNNRK